MQDRLKAEKRAGEKAGLVSYAKLPSADAPIDEIITARRAHFQRTKARVDAEQWQTVHVRDALPIGIVWFGDPHIDDDGCNWPLLERHILLCAAPGVYGANIGDSTNNWAGRLARLYSKQETSAHTARRLAKWFMADCGVTWLLWLMGNHDLWDSGADLLRSMDIHNKVEMRDWAAKIELRFPGGTAVRVHAAHDFPGHSMWNIGHGPLRAARMGGSADLYVCGHKHDWTVGAFETADGRCPVIARARGYKWHDEYATVGGFQQSQHGAAIMTIIDPRATAAGRVLAFADVEQGAAVLKALRGGK